MRLLLDSHVLIWWLEDPNLLDAKLKALLRDNTNEAYFSPASIWELGLKSSKGQLHMPSSFADHLISDGINELAVTAVHAMRSLTLPHIHFDPFDRMLVSQALCEGLVLATRDTTVMRYDVPTIEA